MPASARQIADRGVRLGVDTRRQEALEARAGLVDDAERRIVRPRQLRGRLDELLQERVQRELRAESDPGIDEHT